MFGRVYMNKKWGNLENKIQKLKKLSTSIA
jgi:hypothetical protein